MGVEQEDEGVGRVLVSTRYGRQQGGRTQDVGYMRVWDEEGRAVDATEIRRLGQGPRYYHIPSFVGPSESELCM